MEAEAEVEKDSIVAIDQDNIFPTTDLIKVTELDGIKTEGINMIIEAIRRSTRREKEWNEIITEDKRSMSES